MIRIILGVWWVHVNPHEYLCIVSGREVGDAGCEDLEAPEIFVSYGDCGNEEILGTVAAVLVMSMRR